MVGAAKIRVVLLSFVGFLAVFAHTPARADAIDGDWCFLDGKHMSISGSAIVTPAGTQTSGNYSRHAFSYIVPDTEEGAGSAIAMVLISDNVLHLSIAAQPLAVWNRCAPAVSFQAPRQLIPERPSPAAPRLAA